MDLTDLKFPDTLHKWTFMQDPNNPDTPENLSFVGLAFWERHAKGRLDVDLERAISCFEKSIGLTPKLDPQEGIRLFNLGRALWARFLIKGDVSDIDTACFFLERGLLTEPGNPPATWMVALAGALSDRFECTGDSADLARVINLLRRAVEVTPGKDSTQAFYSDHLGRAFRKRFKSFGDISDLEAAMSAQRQAVELTADDHPDMTSYLSELGLAHETRFERFGDISDLKAAIAARRQVVELTPDGHPDKPRYLGGLGNAYHMQFKRFGNVSDLEMAISTLQTAVKHTPDGDHGKPGRISNLSVAYQTRFDCFGEVSDLDATTSFKRQVVELTPDSHPDKPLYLNNLGNALETRFVRLGDVSDLEVAISNNLQAVELTADGHPSKSTYLSNLGIAYQTRFHHFRDVSDLNAAIAVKRQVVELTPDGHPEMPNRLTGLGIALAKQSQLLTDTSNLDTAISLQRQAVELTPDSHPEKAIYFNNLGAAYKQRFNYLGNESDLQSTIDAWQMSVNSTSDGFMAKMLPLCGLADALARRYLRNGNMSDLDSAITAASTATQYATGNPGKRIEAARTWAWLSKMADDQQQMMQACDCAIGLIPRVAWMGLAIEGRYQQLERVGELVRGAAATAVQSGEHNQALQWLEQGRSVVWGQTLQQRSPLDILRERDPIRANRLAEISRVLESNVPFSGTRGEQIRALVLEWDALVLEVREIEGFEDFLGSKTVARLLTAASSHPVVVLNTHEAGCDALILMTDMDTVIHIPLNFNSQRAQELLVTLEAVTSRHSRGRNARPPYRGFKFFRRDSNEPDKLFKSLLAELWTSVVKPVLEGLAFSLPENDGKDLPRICWCPTGHLAFLPIHAAGIYDTNARGTKVFDFVVSSYTPTVSALLQATSSSPTRPKIFAVAQAKQTNHDFSALPNARKEIQRIIQRAAANSTDLTVAEDGEGTVERVLKGMSESHWIHLACHGIQDLNSPTKSAFVLADGDLELLEIIKHPLPHAEFAFLSACQTATGNVKLAEEAVHLAAGMMLAGYRSVIATTWSILDKDGPEVADAVYCEMLKGGKADYTRAAHALHRATHKLRLSGAPFMAWIPFIHMGA